MKSDAVEVMTQDWAQELSQAQCKIIHKKNNSRAGFELTPVREFLRIKIGHAGAGNSTRNC